MTSAASLYHSVINDVVASVRDSFLDEAVDENVLQELKQLWMSKLDASKTIEPAQKGQDAALDTKMAFGRGGRAAANSSSASAAVASAGPAAAASGSGDAGALPGVGGPSAGPAAATTAGNQLVITDPNRLVPVQITIPPQPGNPTSQPRALTVQVPAHALQQSGSTSQLLQQVLTQAITQALSLPESHAAVFLQNQINHAFKLQ